MTPFARTLALAAAPVVLFLAFTRAHAQVVVATYPAPPVVAYSVPVVPAYPVVTASYYTPRVVAYPVPAVTYAAPVVAPAAVSTTTRYGLFGRPRAATVRYYAPAVVVP